MLVPHPLQPDSVASCFDEGRGRAKSRGPFGMMNGWIAGHSFKDGVCQTCQRHWVDIRNFGDANINQSGIAHTGVLTAREAMEIEVAREREDRSIEAAFGDLANG